MSIDPASLDRQSKESYGPEYEKHLFEQYKLYVEMADRISARRMLANSFFVGVHTALITAFTVLLQADILRRSVLGYAPFVAGLLHIVGYAPFVAGLLLCFVWWRIVVSYRQLNSGKFKVVHALEGRLPVAPYDAEWVALGSGKNPKLYRPLTHVENWVPLCFVLLYLLLAGALWGRA